MHPSDCPNWQYGDYPLRKQVVPVRVSEILVKLRTQELDTLRIAVETRGVHGQIFAELTPPDHDYFAGHYRGEDFRCLRFYQVTVRGDPRVGRPPHSVAFWMQELGAKIRVGIAGLDGNVLITPKDRLHLILALTCHIFVGFLTIHPYADGNGHIARIIVWCLLGRYGHWPKNWTVEPRPPDPPYSQLIAAYRSGNIEPMERYFLQNILATQPAIALDQPQVHLP